MGERSLACAADWVLADGIAQRKPAFVGHDTGCGIRRSHWA